MGNDSSLSNFPSLLLNLLLKRRMLPRKTFFFDVLDGLIYFLVFRSLQRLTMLQIKTSSVTVRGKCPLKLINKSLLNYLLVTAI